MQEYFFEKLNFQTIFFIFIILIRKNKKIIILDHKKNKFLSKVLKLFFKKKINFYSDKNIPDSIFLKTIYTDFVKISKILDSYNINKHYQYYINNILFELSNKSNSLFRTLILLNKIIYDEKLKIKVIYLERRIFSNELIKYFNKTIEFKFLSNNFFYLKTILNLLFNFINLNYNKNKKINTINNSNKIIFDLRNDNIFNSSLWHDYFKKDELYYIEEIKYNNISNNKINEYSNFKNIFININVPFYIQLKKLFKNKSIFNLNFYKNKFDNHKYIYTKIFKELEIDIFVSMTRFTYNSIAKVAVASDLNLVSIFYQSNFNVNYPAYGKYISDIFFATNNDVVNKELNNGSYFKYNIITGYIYDYKFKKNNNLFYIKKKFINNNVKKTIGFFDNGFNNSLSEFLNSKNLISLYDFFLDKLIHNKNIGMIFKPKIDKSIFIIKENKIFFKDEFSILNNKLSIAMETGRLYVIHDLKSQLIKNKRISPAEVASICDVTINSMLYSVSASIESALCDIPSIIFNNIDNYDLDIIKSNKENIIYNDLKKLWVAVDSLLFSDNSIIGNWSSFIDQIDPYRDGNSIMRCISFIDNINCFLKDGLKKDIAIQKAIDIYKKKWGADKVIIN